MDLAATVSSKRSVLENPSIQWFPQLETSM